MTDRLESTKNEGGRRGRAVSTGAGFGLAGAVIAYVFWGLMPLYWHLMAAVDSVEVLAHRIVWSFVFIVAVLVATGRTGEALRHIRAVFTKTHAPMARVIIAASAFASANWLINILGVNTGRVVELGIGTFLTPLATAAIGICVFFLLALVFMPGVGRTVNGARRWISLFGVMNLQVSEMVKVAALIFTAAFTVKKQDYMHSFLSGFFPMAFVMVLIPSPYMNGRSRW